LQAIAVMHQGTIIELSSVIAVTAAQLGALHKMPLADSIIYSTAKHTKSTIYTQDSDFKNLDNIKYIPKVYKLQYNRNYARSPCSET
jgi:toxin FitB